MNAKSRSMIIGLTLLMVIAIGISGYRVSADQNSLQRNEARIETAAKLAQTGDEAAVRLLIDAIFAIDDEIPAEVVDPLKDRVLRAQLQFQQGLHPFISDEQIADGVNHIANQLELPLYTRTDAGQIQHLQMSVLHIFPVILQSNLSSGRLTGTHYSPVQAAFLQLLMIRQKISNPFYQIPKPEWDSRETSEGQSMKSDGKSIHGPRTAEVRAAIAARIPALTSIKGTALGHEALDHSGIAR